MTILELLEYAKQQGLDPNTTEVTIGNHSPYLSAIGEFDLRTATAEGKPILIIDLSGTDSPYEIVTRKVGDPETYRKIG